jgi:hypothetical protein
VFRIHPSAIDNNSLGSVSTKQQESCRVGPMGDSDFHMGGYQKQVHTPDGYQIGSWSS